MIFYYIYKKKNGFCYARFLYNYLVSKARTSQSRFSLSLSVKKPTRKWHIWFFPTLKPTLKKPKEPFFANAQTNKQKDK